MTKKQEETVCVTKTTKKKITILTDDFNLNKNGARFSFVESGKEMIDSLYGVEAMHVTIYPDHAKFEYTIEEHSIDG